MKKNYEKLQRGREDWNIGMMEYWNVEEKLLKTAVEGSVERGASEHESSVHQTLKLLKSSYSYRNLAEHMLDFVHINRFLEISR